MNSLIVLNTTSLQSIEHYRGIFSMCLFYSEQLSSQTSSALLMYYILAQTASLVCCSAWSSGFGLSARVPSAKKKCSCPRPSTGPPHVFSSPDGVSSSPDVTQHAPLSLWLCMRPIHLPTSAPCSFIDLLFRGGIPANTAVLDCFLSQL